MLEGLALARSRLDRAAVHRADTEWLARRWVEAGTAVLLVSGGQVPVDPDDPSRLRLLAPQLAPDGLRVLVGVDEVDRAYFAVVTEPGVEPVMAEATRWAGLREIGGLLPDAEAGMVVHAVAVANWHATHTHCTRCGADTEPVLAGAVRRCPVDGSEHYPRTDPAVIMTVVDPGGRLLLGHQSRWPQGRYSTLAGFVEPGESLEQAVRREVAEEVGLRVRQTRYLGSQPWPFPSSLMLGFMALVDPGEPVVDGEEISLARWFTREELAAALAEGSVALPPRVSIARRLIEHWYGAPLATPERW